MQGRNWRGPLEGPLAALLEEASFAFVPLSLRCRFLEPSGTMPASLKGLSWTRVCQSHPRLKASTSFFWCLQLNGNGYMQDAGRPRDSKGVGTSRGPWQGMGVHSCREKQVSPCHLGSRVPSRALCDDFLPGREGRQGEVWGRAVPGAGTAWLL